MRACARAMCPCAFHSLGCIVGDVTSTSKSRPHHLCFRAAARQSGESDQEQFGVVHRMTKAGASQSVIGATKVLAAHGGAAGCGARLQATRSSRELHKRANRRCMGVRIENE